MQTEEGRKAIELYQLSLNELDSDIKFHIIVGLKDLAEEYKEYAVDVAACIENHLKTVENSKKLPVLYLINYICEKNPKSLYVELFTQNIVSNFCKVFEVSKEKARKSLHKLRMIWHSSGIFPQKKLNAIDERVHKMDPNWPIIHKQQPTKQQQQPISQQRQQNQQQHEQSHSQQNRINSSTNNEITGSKRSINNSNNINNNNGPANGRRKRPRLVPQQQQQQQQQIRNILPLEPAVLIPAPQPYIDPNIMQQATPQDLPQVHPTSFMDPSITIASIDQLHHVPTATYIDPNLIIASAPPPQAVPSEPQLQGPPPQQQQPVPQLICTPYNQTQSQPNNAPESRPAHLTVLDSLYGGKQCSNCSLRFDDNNRYSIHLDWHYRQNLKSDNMLARRKWYYPLDLWVQFREINDDDLQENNNTDSNVKVSSTPIHDHEVPTAPASKDDEKNICSVCHETFEKFWAEDEEEWRLKNAKLYEDERVYHPLCLIDMLQPSVA